MSYAKNAITDAWNQAIKRDPTKPQTVSSNESDVKSRINSAATDLSRFADGNTQFEWIPIDKIESILNGHEIGVNLTGFSPSGQDSGKESFSVFDNVTDIRLDRTLVISWHKDADGYYKVVAYI